ncbi:MAG TPA: arginyltransferase [Tepidisphaeraceae bacterium]|jgi:arginine-tRNA-protein transferase
MSGRCDQLPESSHIFAASSHAGGYDEAMAANLEHLLSHYPSWRPPLALDLTIMPEHPCVYRPGRAARMRAFYADSIPPDLYHQFMDAGFRRSGKVIYQPMCAGCRGCIPIRIPTARFRPDKSQRRCRRRNQDLRVNQERPSASAEKFAIYQRYQQQWHGGEMGTDFDSFVSFLYESPVESVEFTCRDDSGRLLAVGLCDLCESSLSSVYFYFDPADAQRGLGTFGALCELEFARLRNIPYYYLGYWVSDCRTMAYKTSFRPCELLSTDGIWREKNT